MREKLTYQRSKIMSKKLWSAAGAIVLALAMNSSWAVKPNPGGGGDPPGQVKVPEINVGAGGSAIALLAGTLLLMRERARRSAKSSS
jgi:hypothetical protein